MGYARRLDVARFAILGVGTTIDISTGGIRFTAHEMLFERARVELELVLDGRPARIEEARVLRVASRRDGTFEVAARFEEAGHASRSTIAAFVEERLMARR
jgi:hypothetical protein